MSQSPLDDGIAGMLDELKRKNRETMAGFLREGLAGKPPGIAQAHRAQMARRLSGIWAGRSDLKLKHAELNKIRQCAPDDSVRLSREEKAAIARRLSRIWVGRPDLAQFDGLLRKVRKR